MAFEYTEFEFLFDYVRKIWPALIVNAEEVASLTASRAQDREILDSERTEMLQANTLLPQTIARVCSLTNTPLAHVSSGSIYCGSKIIENGHLRVETDLGGASAGRLFDIHPELFLGYTELDEPNCSFKRPSSNFCSGTKALAEEAVRQYPESYIWRLHRPLVNGMNQGISLHSCENAVFSASREFNLTSRLSNAHDCQQVSLRNFADRIP